MAERGRGASSANVIRPQLRDGGTKAILGAKVLEKAADMLENVENMSPQTMARKGRKQVAEALRSVQAGLSGVTQGTDQLLRASGMQYPANKRVREMVAAGSGEAGGCNLISLLDQCKESPQTGSALSKDTSSGDSTEVCSRLRPFDVQGIKVPMPLNSVWYQTKELVHVLRQVRQEHTGGRGILKEVYAAMKSRGFVSISYQAAMYKVKKVDDTVELNPQLNAAEVLDQRVVDRLSRDEPSLGGGRDIMTEDEFKDAVRQRTVNERSCKMEDYHAILLDAKKKQMERLGHDTGTATVCHRTVKRYCKLLGGDKDLKVRGKVSKKTHARIQGSVSIMHLITYVFATLCTHVVVADDGVGETPPEDPWGLLAAVQAYWGVPIAPIDPSLIANMDSSTIGVALNPDGDNDPEFWGNLTAMIRARRRRRQATRRICFAIT